MRIHVNVLICLIESIDKELSVSINVNGIVRGTVLLGLMIIEYESIHPRNGDEGKREYEKEEGKWMRMNKPMSPLLKVYCISIREEKNIPNAIETGWSSSAHCGVIAERSYKGQK